MLFGLGVQELVVIIVGMMFPIIVGRFLAHRVSDEKRKIIGGILLFIVVILVFSGIIFLNSGTQAQSEEIVIRAAIALWISVFMGILGIVILASKSRKV